MAYQRQLQRSLAWIALGSCFSTLIPASLGSAGAQAGSGTLTAAAPKPSVRIGGSSTVFPIVQQARKDFRAAGNTMHIDLQESGSSDGFRHFCAGHLAIANASRPINSKELKACASKGITFIELPIAFDALTVVVHPANNWATAISTKELARLWGRQAQGVVDRWDEVNAAWPKRPIKLCGPGKDSGTFDYFNKAINGDPDNSRTDFTSSEDDMVIVRCVASDPNALGYFGFSYYADNNRKLRALPIASTSAPVMPSVANVQAGRYQPLSRPLFVYINDKDLQASNAVRSFTTYLVRNGLRLVEEAGMIALPASTYRLVETKLYRRIPGTAFGGDLPVGLSIGEALRRSFDETKRPQYR
jgi:phosphate transport system substrate-binding protein